MNIDPVVTLVVIVLAVLSVLSQFVILLSLSRKADLQAIKDGVDKLSEKVNRIGTDEIVHASEARTMRADIGGLKERQEEMQKSIRSLSDDQREVRTIVTNILHNQGAQKQ